MRWDTTRSRDLLDYDEDVLKEVYLYFIEIDKKKWLQRKIGAELRHRQEIRLDLETEQEKAKKPFYGWGVQWKKEWDEARMLIRNAKTKHAEG